MKRPKTADREFLLAEVDAYLAGLCAIGDVSGIKAAFNQLNPIVSKLSTPTLWDIYQEHINDTIKSE